MLKSTFYLFLACACITSCTKTELSNNGSVTQTVSNDLTFPTTNEFASCKLRRFYQPGPGPNGITTALITYNGAGNPYSVVYENIATAFQNYYFQYDKQGRLKGYKTRYSADDPMEEVVHVYGYDANNRIVTDTIPGFNVSTITYDSQGRVVKETIRYNNTAIPTRNPTYTYDSRGNLAVAGWKSSSYDYKVSIFRSHPVFQFIFRNYSKNNAAPQAKYNSKGLPLSMDPGNDAFFNAYGELGFGGITKAIYDCQ